MPASVLPTDAAVRTLVVPSSVRDVHEAVPPPVPLIYSVPVPKVHRLRPSSAVLVKDAPVLRPTAACVTGPSQRAHWLATIAKMEQAPLANPAELQTIRGHIVDGVTLPLLSAPSAVKYNNTSTVSQYHAEVRERIRDYLSIDAIIPLGPDHDMEGQGTQPLHAIIREDKKPRLVIDLSRNLNSFLEYQYFHYSSVQDAVEASHPGCYYAKLDLSNCFLSFPLHPSVRKYFVFRFDDRLYQFTKMPFGLSTAPRVCTLLLSVLSFALTQLGITHIRYLDDILIIGRSSSQVKDHMVLAQLEIAKFGLVVNDGKPRGPVNVCPS